MGFVSRRKVYHSGQERVLTLIIHPNVQAKEEEVKKSDHHGAVSNGSSFCTVAIDRNWPLAAIKKSVRCTSATWLKAAALYKILQG